MMPSDSTIWRHRRALGEATSSDPRRVRAHIDKLLAVGMTYGGIARLAGCNPATVRHAHLGHRSRLWRKTGEAILGVAMDDRDECAKVSSWKTMMLMAEMRRHGVTNEQISDILGRTHKRGMTNLIGPERVSAETEARFALIYRHFATQRTVPASLLDEVNL